MAPSAPARTIGLPLPGAEQRHLSAH